MNHLTAPLTMDEIRTRAAAREHNYISGVVAVDLSDFIDNDFEGVLDLLSERLTGGPLLMDHTYTVVGHDGDTLHIELTGDASMIIECEDS